MKTSTRLLAQLERCGHAAELAQIHQEVGPDMRGARDVRTEISRAIAANDQAQLPEAQLALEWLLSQPGELHSVGEEVNLIDWETGEILASGKPGAILWNPVRVIVWQVGDNYDTTEPEDDIGLLAMGLAVAGRNRPFQVGPVVLKDGAVYPRLSFEIAPERHNEILERIKRVVSRPRVPCPGEWCAACRQAPYCEAWLARARTALTALSRDDGEFPTFDLTNENAGQFMERIKLVEKVIEWANDQAKAFVRKGGRCVVDGKEYYEGWRDGRASVSFAKLDTLIAAGEGDSPEVAQLKLGIRALIKHGQAYSQFGWRKVQTVARR